MTVLHLATPRVYPHPGGMEEAVLRIGRLLGSSGRSRVIVHTTHQAVRYRLPDPAHEGIEVAHLSEHRSLLMEPLEAFAGDASGATPSPYQLEVHRTDYLLLHAAVQARIQRHPDAAHFMISFYASTTGFLAQQVALALGIPHVASVRGSDYSRDMRNPYHCQALRFVVGHARLVVTTNQEQARTLAVAFPSNCRFRTIHNAMAREVTGPLWQPLSAETVRLVSDCGFSSKKATHLLLRATADLLEMGLPASLTLLGGIVDGEERYWEDCRRRYLARFPAAFAFPGLVGAEEVDAIFRPAHIYCSATLGEGCSQSRVRALTLGIPIVTTRCGALPELAADCRHVRLCPPGDLDSLRGELQAMVQEIRAGALSTDHERIQQWRRYFTPERERADWESAIAEASGPCLSMSA